VARKASPSASPAYPLSTRQLAKDLSFEAARRRFCHVLTHLVFNDAARATLP
jgi:hypothetical protein